MWPFSCRLERCNYMKWRSNLWECRTGGRRGICPVGIFDCAVGLRGRPGDQTRTEHIIHSAADRGKGALGPLPPFLWWGHRSRRCGGHTNSHRGHTDGNGRRRSMRFGGSLFNRPWGGRFLWLPRPRLRPQVRGQRLLAFFQRLDLAGSQRMKFSLLAL